MGGSAVMRKLIVLAVAALFSVSLGLGVALSAEAPKGPIKVTNFGKKAAVTFDHAKHKDIKCDTCHHMEKEGKYKCGDCHKAEAQGKVIKLMDAAHKKDVGKCWGCHRAADAKNKLKCADCHKG
jgi:hypothetical protein